MHIKELIKGNPDHPKISMFFLMLVALQAYNESFADAEESCCNILFNSDLPKFFAKSDVLLLMARLYELSCLDNEGVTEQDIGIATCTSQFNTVAF